VWYTAVVPLGVVNTPLPLLLPRLLGGCEPLLSIANGAAWLPLLGFRPIVEPRLVPLSMTAEPPGVEGCEDGCEMEGDEVDSFSSLSAMAPRTGMSEVGASGLGILCFSTGVKGWRCCMVSALLRCRCEVL